MGYIVEELLLWVQIVFGLLGLWVDGLYDQNIGDVERFGHIRAIGGKFSAHFQLIQGIRGNNIRAFGSMNQLNDFSGEHFDLAIKFQIMNDRKYILNKLTCLLMGRNMTTPMYRIDTFHARMPRPTSAASTQPSQFPNQQIVDKYGGIDTDWIIWPGCRRRWRIGVYFIGCSCSPLRYPSIIRSIFCGFWWLRIGCLSKFLGIGSAVFTSGH